MTASIEESGDMRIKKLFLELVQGTLMLVLLFTNGLAIAQGQESSPIQVDIVAPQQANPGAIFEVSIQYDATDLNAGADLNYNVFGPCHIWRRDPEPPNPIVNTWLPTRDTARGTIKIQIAVDEGTDGQFIQHQVQVRWGSKSRTFSAQTEIKYVPPTPTMTPTRGSTPQPQPTRPSATPTRSPLPILKLLDVGLLDSEGTRMQSAETNQSFVLDILYTSSDALRDMEVLVRFDPDVVNLEGFPHTDEGYVIDLAELPAALETTSLSKPLIQGRIRPYPEGGATYELRAIAQFRAKAPVEFVLPNAVASDAIPVRQVLLVNVQASVDATTARTGSSIIVHAICENPGSISIRGLVLHLTGFPAGFSVSPDDQAVELLSAGASEQRLFTVHTPASFEGQVSFRAVATLDTAIIESKPVDVLMASPVPLELDISTTASTVYAGQSLLVESKCINNSSFTYKDVTAKLVDTSGNLGTLFQEIGDIAPGVSKDLVFVVDIPPDFPVDAFSTLAVQTVSEDGSLSESDSLPITIVCVSDFEVLVQPPVGRLQAGQSLEVVATVRNISQCTARDLFVSIEGLPENFTVPPAQKIVELAPGDSRYLSFSTQIPQGYRGTGNLTARLSHSGGSKIDSQAAVFSVGGVSMVFTIVFGILVVLSVAAVVVGTVLYVKHR
jgi:hypothetical protein